MNGCSLQSLPKLYQLPSTARCFLWSAIPAIASAGAGILGSIFGGGGRSAARAYEEAGRRRQQAALQAASRLDTALSEAKEYLSGYRGTGDWATEQLRNLWTPGGRSASQILEETPGYQFLLRQAIGGTPRDPYTGALGRYGSATGLMASGPALKGAIQYSQDLALAKALDPYRRDMSTLYTGGLQAASDTAKLGVAGAEKVGDYWMQAAGANTEAQIQALNAANANRAALNQELFGSIGLGIGGIGALGRAMGWGTGGGGYAGGGGSGYAGGGGGSWGSGTEAYINSLPSMQYLQGMMSRYGMADGGLLPAGQYALVGERGPEIVRFFRDGYVIPNHLLGLRLRPWALVA